MVKNREVVRRAPRIFFGIRSGQSFIEYTMLIIVVSIALIAMTVYVSRAMNAALSTKSSANK